MTNHRNPVFTFLTRAVFLALVFAGLSASTALAQEAHEKSYFAGQEAQNAGDLETAYTQFTQASKEAASAGATEMQMNAEYRAGAVAYQLKRTAAIGAHFQKAYELAQQINNAEMLASTGKVLAQLAYSEGSNALKQEQYDAALEAFERGIGYNAAYSRNYYGRGLARKNLDDAEGATAAYIEAISVATEEGDTRMVRTAEGAIRSLYIANASQALARGGDTPSAADAEEAVSHLQAMEEYVELDADAQYYLAEAYKALGQYDQAIAAANKGLELHSGSKSDAAKLHFVKGEALMMQGNNSAAVAAFREATYGSFKAPAEHYIETLGTN